MSDSVHEKYPRVGVVLIVISKQGKWIVDVRNPESALPYRELFGGETWEQAASSLLEDLKVEPPKELELAGIGAGVGPQREGLVYCAFTVRGVPEAIQPGYDWQAPEKTNKLNELSLCIKESFLSSYPQIWTD